MTLQQPTPFPSRTYQPGEVLFNRGDEANVFYVIQRGEVDFFVPPDNTFMVRLGPGASFGEQALLRGGVRNAKAVAVSELVCTEITARTLQETVLSQQTLIRPVLEALLMQLSLNNAVRSVLPGLFDERLSAVDALEHLGSNRVPQAK
jgi:CRP-like cAMP-binding protein